MSWVERLKEAAYTSPSGKRYTFEFEDVSKSFSKKTTAFEFADQDGTYIQDLGRSGRRLPMRFFFSGPDYDAAANNFENALAETGIGILEHPMYGSINVVPRGEVVRRDALVTAANQAVIEVTLWESIGIIYPSPQGNAAAAVAEAIDLFGIAGAGAFDRNMSLSSLVEQALSKNPIANGLTATKAALKSVADAQEDVGKAFDAAFDSINDGLDTLVGTPLTLAFQAQLLIGAPARAFALFKDKLAAYANLARSIFGKDAKSQSVTSQNENEYHIDAMFATSSTVGAASSAIFNEFTTKEEALQAAEDILELAEELNTWQEENLESLAIIDTGEVYQAVERVISLVAGFLVEISFTLLQERTVTLDRDRTIVDLVGELYGEIDGKLDFFINSNNLSGDEIYELPRGRKIVYYV